MIFSIPALQDATIYEKDPYRNTGLDSILELKKQGDISTGNFTESRILIKFDLTNLSASLSENGVSINDVNANLRLYTVQYSDLPKTYTIEAKMLSENWVNGSGYHDLPDTKINATTITDGATWKTVAGTGSLQWINGSSAGSTASFVSESGGGRYITSSIASQSFSFKSDDLININVTEAVKYWYNGTYTNNGFLISYKASEITASNYPESNIQFYSSDTATVFEPQLYIQWTGSQTYQTGSLSTITYEDNPIVYTRTFKREYLKDKKIRILLGSRPKYPRPVFTQNNFFSTIKALPINSYYQIKDAHNEQIIIPYNDYTKINTDSSGSYFDFYTTMMYPERYYKFEIKSEFSGVTEYFTSNDFIFKIVK